MWNFDDIQNFKCMNEIVTKGDIPFSSSIIMYLGNDIVKLFLTCTHNEVGLEQ